MTTAKGWSDFTMSELFSIKHGFGFDGKYFASEGDYILLTPGNFKDEGGFKLKTKEKFFTGDFDEQYLLPKGSLIVAMTEQAEGLLGSSALIPGAGKFLHNQRLGLIAEERRDRIDIGFLYYLFNTRNVRAQIRGAATGTKVRHTSPTRIGAVKVTIPNVPTQRKIASILSAYDDLIENNTRRIAILEEMAQAIYREWFVNFHFPGHETVKLVDSTLGQTPDGWKIFPIDALCSKITDGAHRSPKSVDVGLPMASMKDMETWRLNLSTARRITQDDFDELVRIDCKPLKGDVLIAKDGASYLKYIFVVEQDEEVVLLSSVAILRPNGRLDPYLMAMILNDPPTKGRLANYVTGAAIPRVILKDFKRFEILVPPSDIQGHWHERTAPAIQLIHRLLKKNDNLRTTRDLLLPKLISGQLDVEDLDIDVGMTAEENAEAAAG